MLSTHNCRRSSTTNSSPWIIVRMLINYQVISTFHFHSSAWLGQGSNHRPETSKTQSRRSNHCTTKLGMIVFFWELCSPGVLREINGICLIRWLSIWILWQQVEQRDDQIHQISNTKLVLQSKCTFRGSSVSAGECLRQNNLLEKK